MPGSATAAFTEPDDFEAALRSDGCLSLLVAGRGQFRARLTQVVLHDLRLSAVEEQLSRVAFLAVPADMLLLVFSVDRTALPIYGSIAARSGDLVAVSPGEQLHVRTTGRSHAGALWLPVKELVRYGVALTGAPVAISPVVQRWHPAREALKHLRELHAAAVRTAVRHPRALVDPEAAHGLEQQLIHAVVECLAGASIDTDTPSRRRHQNTMVCFEHLLRGDPERHLRIGEICATLGVSERLLRSLCAQHLGMGPVGYDRLRRMSLVRRALRREDRAKATVSAVARRYGFHSPGRFAVNYRAAFGASPSATLRRA
jgi:AraC-like DNA-binding protein